MAPGAQHLATSSLEPLESGTTLRSGLSDKLSPGQLQLGEVLNPPRISPPTTCMKELQARSEVVSSASFVRDALLVLPRRGQTGSRPSWFAIPFFSISATKSHSLPRSCAPF